MNSDKEIVYLSGPIDGAEGKLDNLKNDIIRTLNSAGISVYSPAHAFKTGKICHNTASAIYKINKTALTQCNAVIIIVDFSVPSVGTWMELEQAVHYGKTVILYYNNPADVERDFVNLAGYASFQHLDRLQLYFHGRNS